MFIKLGYEAGLRSWVTKLGSRSMRCRVNL